MTTPNDVAALVDLLTVAADDCNISISRAELEPIAARTLELAALTGWCFVPLNEPINGWPWFNE